jgi:transcriptional regulator with XRE-family HTH domain|tara:strand:+ start:1335 stop:1694 length:360 start_codon:yes stop_codon:yes gene_type:complete
LLYQIDGVGVMSFPERLKAARLALGLTQEQLGDELHVTKSTISAWENGRDSPGFRLLPKLKAVLGVSLDHLICGDQVEGASELKSKYDAQVRNDAEAQLLKGYRRLSVKRRQGLLAMID